MTKRYELLDRLGEGGAGAVFKAWDTRLQRYVAIKKLLPAEQRLGLGVGTDLAKEASALSALQHPNIVSVYDLDEIDGESVVVMEFLNGETLEQTIRRGALAISDFASVAKQSLEGLVAAHRLGVQHRDIKPSNIMVNWLPNGDFLVKMLDFGLADFTAKAPDAAKGDEDSAYGSVHFMAPEQFTRRPVDVRTDIYSLGCVFYYALSSAFPFTGRNMEEIIDAHLGATPQPLTKLRQDVPKALADWIAWMMNRDPEQRPARAEQALEALRAMEAGKTANVGAARRPMPGVRNPTGSVTAVPAAKKPGVSSATERHKASSKAAPPPISIKPILISAIVVVALGLGFVIWQFTKKSPDPSVTTESGLPQNGLSIHVEGSQGLKKNFGAEPAKLGDKVDYWQDISSLAGGNHLHYINTNISGRDGPLREGRLPKAGEFRRGNVVFPVLNFDGGSCLLIVTDDKGDGKIPIENNIDLFAAPEITLVVELSVDESPWRSLLFGAGNEKLKASWEVACDKGSFLLGTAVPDFNYASLKIPPNEGLFTLVVSISNKKREGRLSLTTNAGVTTVSEVAQNLSAFTPLTRLRLSGKARTQDGADNAFFRGNIAELLMYPRSLSTDETRQCQEYLRKKYSGS